MAKSRTANKARRARTAARSQRSKRGNGARGDDAVHLLKADHRAVEKLFAEFKSARSEHRREDIAARICNSLKVHASIEEEIFYPAFLEATEETDIHHEAEIEHEGAKRLIAEIEAEGSADDHFEARVTVLEEMIRHHVKEEEQRGGMFVKAQKSSMDLTDLGRQLFERKLELMADSAEGSEDTGTHRLAPQSRARRSGRELSTR